MSYHHCPIEPDDWTNGPSYLEGDCLTCDGTGTVDSDTADGEDETCPACGGSGFTEHDHFEDDVI